MATPLITEVRRALIAKRAQRKADTFKVGNCSVIPPAGRSVGWEIRVKGAPPWFLRSKQEAIDTIDRYKRCNGVVI